MRILVTGAGGQVGGFVARAAEVDHEVLAADHSLLDLADPDVVQQVVGEFAPDAIINCAAVTNVDACERDPERAYAVNTSGVRTLSIAAARVGAHLVHVSTDYVFDGRTDRPYHEWDDTAPLSVYGRSKLGGELEVASHAQSWAIVRSSWIFGRRGHDIVSWVLDTFARGELHGVIDDQRSKPTYAPDLAMVLARLAIDRRAGLYHVVNQGDASRYELACAALELRGLDPSAVKAISGADLHRPAVRPAYTVLDDLALRLAGLPRLRPWSVALAEYLETDQ
jgi:dTDP-4-dehydrorhamnose reductase